MATFIKATKKLARLRLAFNGPAGAGKTYSALSVASYLGTKIAVIDTERGSASKYANLFAFDVLELDSFHPEKFIDAIRTADAAGYDVVIIDSLSHAWIGKGGALELVDNAAARSKSGNSFAAWREVTPIHNALVEAILQSKCHVIATMRAKTEYSLERDERTGKTVPRKIGLAPVQRDGMEFEFDVVGDLDQQNSLSISKSRCPELHNAVIARPGADLARKLKAWLSDATVPAPAAQAQAQTHTHGNGSAHAKEQVRAALRSYAGKHGQAHAIAKMKAVSGAESLDSVATAKYAALIAALV